MTLSERLLKFRGLHKLSQRELDRMLGVGLGTVYRIEGEITKPHKARVVFIESQLEKLEKGASM